MTAVRRAALSLLLLALEGALAFLLGLLSGAPEDDLLPLYLWASLAAAAVIVVVTVRFVLGRTKAANVEALLFFAGVLTGALLFAALAEAFVLGIFVSFENGWGGSGVQLALGGSEMGWRTWLSELFTGAPIGGGFVGACLGLLAWASRHPWADDG